MISVPSWLSGCGTTWRLSFPCFSRGERAKEFGERRASALRGTGAPEKHQCPSILSRRANALRSPFIHTLGARGRHWRRVVTLRSCAKFLTCLTRLVKSDVPIFWHFIAE